MVTNIYIADVKLNPTDKNYHRYLIITNQEEGVLLVNRGLYSLSFESLEALENSDVEIKDKRLIGEINL